jgi:hypothetical protein
MDTLKLLALDEEDLAIISAHVQDAVMKKGSLDYLPSSRQFVVAMNRFAWELADRSQNQRRLSLLSFSRVLSARTLGLGNADPDMVLSLLAIRFLPKDPPAGTIELVFSGDAAVRLEVECIEAQLTDTGGVWRASSRPTHKV